MATPARARNPRDSLPSVVEDDDFDLLRKWVSGDRRAGDQLVKRYYVEIARFFMNSVGDQERRDLTNETFTRLCSAAPRFAGRSKFRSFFYGIARNVLNEFLRDQYKRGDFDPQLHSVEEVEQRSISRLISELVRKEVPMRCLRELPVETKQMMELYYWHDMTAEELGEMYGIPAGTVRTRLHNARKRLEKKIAEEEPSISNLNVERQLEALGCLLGFGPRLMEK